LLNVDEFFLFCLMQVNITTYPLPKKEKKADIFEI